MGDEVALKDEITRFNINIEFNNFHILKYAIINSRFQTSTRQKPLSVRVIYDSIKTQLSLRVVSYRWNEKASGIRKIVGF